MPDLHRLRYSPDLGEIVGHARPTGLNAFIDLAAIIPIARVKEGI